MCLLKFLSNEQEMQKAEVFVDYVGVRFDRFSLFAIATCLQELPMILKNLKAISLRECIYHTNITQAGR